MKENEYAPDVTDDPKKLPDSLAPELELAEKLRKNTTDDLLCGYLYKPGPSMNEKRTQAIDAEILRRTQQRFNKEDNWFRCTYDIINLIFEKNSLIEKHV